MDNSKYLRRYTTAPSSYDGFGTFRTGLKVLDGIGRALYEVKILEEHLDWQERRYGSGLHCSLEEEEVTNNENSTRNQY